MGQSARVLTSINICEEKWRKFKECAERTGVSETILLSVLCYKAGSFVCKDALYLKKIDYQARGASYKIMPVSFFAADHEYMHSARLARKISVSKLLACAIDLFLDEIIEKGINPMEIAHLRVIQNSYEKKSFSIRNETFTITKNDQFNEYIMKMRMEKT